MPGQSPGEVLRARWLLRLQNEEADALNISECRHFKMENRIDVETLPVLVLNSFPRDPSSCPLMKSLTMNRHLQPPMPVEERARARDAFLGVKVFHKDPRVSLRPIICGAPPSVEALPEDTA